MRKSLMALSLAIFSVQSSYAADTLFSSLPSSIEKQLATEKSALNVSNKALTFPRSVNSHALSTLSIGDSIDFNVPTGTIGGTLTKTKIGANGSKHYYLQSVVEGQTFTSLITLSDNAVFMELVTNSGVYSATGTPDNVVLYRQNEIFKANNITDEDTRYPSYDAGVSTATPQSVLNSQPSTRSLSKRAGQLDTVGESTENTVENTDTNDYGENAYIDILIVYAKNVEDVVDDIDTKIDHYFAYTNQAFEDSGIFATVRLKKAIEVDYPLNTSSDGLEAISSGDAPFENIANERFAAGADAVVLLQPQVDDDGSAGIAYVVNHYNSYSYGSMYSSVDVDFSASVFAHELGHNLGLGHSRAQGNVGAAFDHGVGYRVPIPDGIGFASIMAYDIYQAATVPYYSNPAKMCGSLPCGVSKSDENFGADAVHAVNEIRHLAAAWVPETPVLTLLDDALSGITDPALLTCLENSVTEDMLYAGQLNIVNCYQDVQSLEGLSAFYNLNTLSLQTVLASDLSPLKALTNLTYLRINNAIADDYTFLSSLPSLQSLVVSGSNFNNTDAASLLPAMTQLQTLDISFSQVTEIPDLSSLVYLENLYAGVPLTDVEGVKNNSMLKLLELSPSGPFQLPTAPNWPLLESLTINNSELTSLSSLGALPNLNALYLSNNSISSIASFADFSNLTSLYLSRNALTSLEGIASLTALTELSISNNEIADVSALSNTPLLKTLNISGLPINDVSVLADLPELTTLYATGLDEITDWQVLSELPNLTSLDLSNTTADTLGYVGSLSQLTSFSTYNNQSSDVSALFSLYRLGSLSLYSSMDTEIYCWQDDYLNNYTTDLYYYSNLSYSGSVCNTSDDDNDFDSDGMSNIDELAIARSPLEDDNDPAIVQFLSATETFVEGALISHVGVVKRTGNTSLTSSVLLDSVEETATEGYDYTLDNVALEFAPGVNYAKFKFYTWNDNTAEEQETFSAVLSSPVNTELGDISEVSIIINDDDSLTNDPDTGFISSNPIGWESLYQLANEADESTTIVLHRPEDVVGEFSVSVSATLLTHLANEEVTLSSSLLEFSETDEFKEVILNFSNDNLWKGTEYVSVRLEHSDTIEIMPEYAAMTVGIEDDDAPDRRIGFQQTNYTVSEGVGSIDLLLVRNLPDIEPVDVTVEYWGGSAINGDDFIFEKTVITLQPEDTQAVIPVTIIDNDDVNPYGNLDFLLKISTDNASTLGDNEFATVEIEDNDSFTGEVSFSESIVYVDETAGTMTIAVERSGDLSGAARVYIDVFDELSAENIATLGTDYAFTSTELYFEPGENTKFVSVNILDDDIDELEESFGLGISAEFPELFGETTYIEVIINANDGPAGQVSFSSAQSSVNENAGSVEITLIRSGGNNGNITISLAATADTAETSDFTFNAQTINFADGEMEKTVSVTIIDDDVDESDESFTISLSSDDTDVIGDIDTITINITDNDTTTTTPPSGSGDSSSSGGGGSISWMLALLSATLLARRKVAMQ